MNTSFLHLLEHHRIISRSPHPLIPFLIALSFFLLSFIPSLILKPIFTIGIFSLLFAIIHGIAYHLLKKKHKVNKANFPSSRFGSHPKLKKFIEREKDIQQ